MHPDEEPDPIGVPEEHAVARPFHAQPQGERCAHLPTHTRPMMPECSPALLSPLLCPLTLHTTRKPIPATTPPSGGYAPRGVLAAQDGPRRRQAATRVAQDASRPVCEDQAAGDVAAGVGRAVWTIGLLI